MQKINRNAILAKLQTEQSRIRYESDDDEGAAQWHGDLQSVIDALESNKTDQQILDAAAWVGYSI